MQNPLARAEHYRKEAAKCHELARYARPAYLGDFYRRVAIHPPNSTAAVVDRDSEVKCRTQ